MTADRAALQAADGLRSAAPARSAPALGDACNPPPHHGMTQQVVEFNDGFLDGYVRGVFPYPHEADLPLDEGSAIQYRWWWPDPRAVLPLEFAQVGKTARRHSRLFEIRFDTAFADVVHELPAKLTVPSATRELVEAGEGSSPHR